jgi:hypothetical protein
MEDHHTSFNNYVHLIITITILLYYCIIIVESNIEFEDKYLELLIILHECIEFNNQLNYNMHVKNGILKIFTILILKLMFPYLVYFILYIRLITLNISNIIYSKSFENFLIL